MTDPAAVDLDSIRLSYGSHESRADGMCLLEAVAFLAGERHTDRPKCVCPVLAAFGRAWNDDLDDEARNRLLRPFIPRLVGTRSTFEVQERRAFLATDWAVRVATPVWLRAAGLDDEAASLEALPSLASAEACREAMGTIRQAREAALAARAAARAAATAAAVDVVRAAAMDAAMDAAVYATEDPDVYPAATAAAVYVARTAAVFAATAAADAASAAAVAAAVAAARGALRPHIERLQKSAVDLFDRMIEVRP